jgi:Carboxypeptidase regulatory-like domain/TonB dependent receptor/TonB-dependent Receptor Plug Domain
MRTRARWSGFAAAVVLMMLALMGATASRAQTFRGSIAGTVTDTTGAAVTGATVTVHNVATGVDRITQTGIDGGYLVPELQVGTYTVTVELGGFQKAVTTGVTVDVATEKRIDVVLKPGAVTNSVTVAGEDIPEVDTTGDTLGGTLTQETVKNLPVNGRDYTKLIYLTPGVAGSPDQISDSPGSYGTFSMNGARGRSNNFLLDGTDMNDGYRNDPAINEAGVFGTPATILPIDAVSELKVLSNFEAEYGRSAGAVINIVTKSGQNALHGDAFDYFRNNALDARNYFDPSGTPQAPFHNNQYGASLGGPIIKDKTFFYVDYEGQQERVGVVSTATVPDPGLLVATNPVIGSLLDAYPNDDPWPLPNLGGNQASVIAPSYNKLTSLIAKVDHNINQNNILTGRYYFGDSVQSFPLALTGGGVLPGFNTYTPTRVQLVSISYVSVLSPTKVNEARFGWNRFAEGFFPEDQAFQPSSVGLCAATTVPDCTGATPSNSGLPVIDVGDFAQLGANHSTPRHRYDTNWQALDNFSWKIGKHDVKFGYEYRRTSIQQFFGVAYRGELDFNSLDDFLSGTVDDGGQALGQSVRHTYQNNHGLYAQDTFQVNPHLTFNLGVRWDYFGVVGEKDNLFTNVTAFDPVGQTVTLTQLGQPGLSQTYHPDYKNFSPRLSVAWDPLGKGKTIVRAGWGMFYDGVSQDVFLGELPYNCLFCPGVAYNPAGPDPIYSVGTTGATIANGVPVFAAPTGAPQGNIFAINQHLPTPYMENYNLNVQEQITNKVMLEVGYVGAQGHNLLHYLDVNQPGQAAITAFDVSNAAASNYYVPNANPALPPVIGGPCVTGGVPTGGPGCIVSYGVPTNYVNNPYGAEYINQLQANAKSNYNSLQTSFRVNNWKGVTSIVNYVWSHSLDTASDSFDFVPNAAQPNDSTHPGLEYGNSNFDIRNRFTWIFAYELPHMGGDWQKLKNGWGINSTVTLQDGQPFNLNYDFEDDFSGSGEGFDRPDVTGPIQYNSHNPSNFLNLGSFSTPCTSLTGAPLAAYEADVAAGLDSAYTSPAQNCVPGTRHFGNEGRNSLRGPSFKQWDFAVFKNTQLTERLGMELRAEFFNFLNHPNFSNPLLPNFIADPAQQGIGTNGAGLGGYALSATGDVGIGNPFLGGGGPRGIQLAAKFTF